MAKLRVSRVARIFTIYAICIASTAMVLALQNDKEDSSDFSKPIGRQQSDEKIIEINEFQSSPIEISDLNYRKHKILPEQKINISALSGAEDGQFENWLEGIEFNLKNKWEKQIVYVKIDLDFPETRVAGSLMVGKLDIGIHPQAARNDKQYGKPVTINPGEIFTYTLSKERASMNNKFLEQRGFQLYNLNKIAIRISNIFFSDGTVWVEGKWFRYNPSNQNAQGGYELINQQP